jgi:trehalose synthase-fused probable maltokinase
MMNASHFTSAINAKIHDGSLQDWLLQQRWFAGKSHSITAVRVLDKMPIANAMLCRVEVSYTDTESECYAVPLMENGTDAIDEEGFQKALFEWMRLSVHVEKYRHYRPLKSRVLSTDQSNTSLVYDDQIYLKFYRGMTPGINVEAEMLEYLAPFQHVPGFVGSAMWLDCPLLLACEWHANRGNAWAFALQHIGCPLSEMSAWLASVRLLGKRTGEMHLALSRDTENEAFRPEWDDGIDCSALRQSMSETAAMLRGANHRVLAAEAIAWLEQPHRFGPIEKALHIRTHGDYHLGQVLVAEDDFLIIDFEGEPARTLAERRAKHPAVRDVAGMLRSLHYAAYASSIDVSTQQKLTWVSESQGAFLQGWREAVAASPISIGHESLLPLYLLEKALYEIRYELNNRPDWLHIPLVGLNDILEPQKCT